MVTQTLGEILIENPHVDRKQIEEVSRLLNYLKEAGVRGMCTD